MSRRHVLHVPVITGYENEGSVSHRLEQAPQKRVQPSDHLPRLLDLARVTRVVSVIVGEDRQVMSCCDPCQRTPRLIRSHDRSFRIDIATPRFGSDRGGNAFAAMD